MTDDLKTLLHDRADRIDFAQPDLAAITRDGDRRARSRTLRRGAAGLAVAAVTAVAVSLALPHLGGRPDTTRIGVATQPSGTTPITWVTGSVIHSGDTQIDVGLVVTSFVRTSAGFVFTDPTGLVHAVIDGQVSDIGRGDPDSHHLVADDDDSRVGWFDPTGERAAFVVHDLASGESYRNVDATQGLEPRATGGETGYFFAIDDNTAYWRDTRGVVAVDLATGTTEEISTAQRDRIGIADAASGQIVFQGSQQTRVGPSLEDSIALNYSGGDLGSLSSDGRWYTQDADEPVAFNTATGERVVFDLEEYAFASGYSWLDDHTLALIAAKNPGTSSAELLSCTVPAGTCQTVVGDLGTLDELVAANFQLPVGEAITGD